MATCTHNFRSNRTYPPRICKNPNCMHGRNYIPHDARQVWCCPPCGVDAYNDVRRALNLSRFQPEKHLREYDVKLGKLYELYLKDQYCAVHTFILQHERIDLSLCVEQQTNKTTGNPIRWYYQFGIEIHPSDNNFFIIQKREIK